MNILDENVPESQRQLLRSWRIRVSQIGDDVGRKGMKDEAIIPLLLWFVKTQSWCFCSYFLPRFTGISRRTKVLHLLATHSSYAAQPSP